MLNREHMAGIKRRDEADASVDRSIAQRTVLDPPDQNRARAAVALRASFLGSGQAPIDAQPIEKRSGRVDTVDLDQIVAQ